MNDNITFEGYSRRIETINRCMEKYGIKNLSEAKKICQDNGIFPDEIIKSIQPIAFENAVWAYTLGCAIAIKSGSHSAEESAKYIGAGLQAFCIPGSVADTRKVGLGHGNLASRLLNENTKCFAFIAGHESFAAAEGAIGIAKYANKARKSPLRVILNGLGKDAAYIISRINGFTYVKTEYDFETSSLKILSEKSFSDSERSNIKCYGANEALEGLEILKHEKVDVSITGNSTNPTRFQHIVAGTYKKWASENDKFYFSVASGGGTGRTLHPDNMAAGPASYGLTDSMGRMHGDAQFAGSSSVPAHVDMMGFIGMGNNPMVGATVACAVATAKS
ncbi:MAG: GGGtGRT protein [Acutalibacteraceae bacterium]